MFHTDILVNSLKNYEGVYISQRGAIFQHALLILAQDKILAPKNLYVLFPNNLYA